MRQIFAFRCVLNFVFRPFEKWGGILFPGVFLFLFFVVDAKSATTNTHGNGSSHVSY